jgi:hypothetical protein
MLGKNTVPDLRTVPSRDDNRRRLVTVFVIGGFFSYGVKLIKKYPFQNKKAALFRTALF